MEFQAAKNAQLTTSQGSVIINIGKKSSSNTLTVPPEQPPWFLRYLYAATKGIRTWRLLWMLNVGRESTVNKDYFHYVRLSRIIVLNPNILFINWSFLFLHIYCSAADFEKLLEPYIFKLGNKGIHAYISVLLQSRLGKTRLYCGSFGNII